MAYISATDYAFKIDGITTADPPALSGSEVTLSGITEFSGINEESVVVDTTALGDDIMTEAPTGQRRFGRITLKGYADDATTGANRRVGPPARSAAYPARTLTVTHKTGVSQAIEVIPIRNDLTPSVDSLTMFEIEFVVRATTSTDYVTTGI